MLFLNLEASTNHIKVVNPNTYLELIQLTKLYLEKHAPEKTHYFGESPNIKKIPSKEIDKALPKQSNLPKNQELKFKNEPSIHLKQPEKIPSAPVLIKTPPKEKINQPLKTDSSLPQKLSLHPVEKIIEKDYEDILDLLEKKASRFKRVKEPLFPGFQNASVAILLGEENADSMLFFQHLLASLSLRGCQTNFVFIKDLDVQKWISSSRTAWILISKSLLLQTPDLKALAKRNPDTKEVQLSQIPTFVIPEFESFFNNPSLKKELWNRLKTFLKLS